MYALQTENSLSRPWLLLAGAAATLGLLLGATTLLDGWRQAAPPLAQPLSVLLMEAAPRVPVEPEPAAVIKPEPPPEPSPARALAPRKRQPAAKAKPELPRGSAAAPPEIGSTAAAPEPLRMGLTLSSTSSRAKGPSFAVGTPGGSAHGRALRKGRPAPVSKEASSPERYQAVKQRTAARLRRGVAPQYPSPARKAGVEGVVVLSITINAVGHVEAAQVLRGLGYGLDESALAAARKSLWEPATLGQRAVKTTRRFSVRFALQG